MAGKNRGWVSIPEIGTEVVISFAYRSLQPYILGAVYNGGDDKPEPYKNDDGNNDKRVFWSRNDHMLIFDDTEVFVEHASQRLILPSTSSLPSSFLTLFAFYGSSFRFRS